MTSLYETLVPLIPYMVPLPIILPAVAAALALILSKYLTAQRTITLSVLAFLIGLNATMLYVVDREGIQTLQLGGWDAPIGITLVADRLSVSMLTVSSIVLFSVMWYAISQGIRDGGKDEPVAVFLPTYLLLSMGVNLAFLAGDLFNLYVGFEVLLVASEKIIMATERMQK